MKKNLLLLIGFIGLLSNVHSAYAVTWNSGKLILRNGAELKGDVNLNWKAGIVQYRQTNRIKAYSVDQVSNLVYFDTQQNALRKFVAVDNCALIQHGRPQFLEEITSGKVMVYRSLRTNDNTSDAANFDMSNAMMRSRNAFTYLVFTDNQWLDFNEFSNEVWPQLIQTHEEELKPYTKMAGIGETTLLGRMIAICKYNALMARTIFHDPSADESILSID